MQHTLTQTKILMMLKILIRVIFITSDFVDMQREVVMITNDDDDYLAKSTSYFLMAQTG